MNNQSKANALDAIENLLDKEIDDLADLPEFKAPHTGIYRLTVTAVPKEIADKAAVEASFVVVDTIELADPTLEDSERSKPGDKFSVAFFLQDNEGKDSELGFGRLKEFVKPFQAHYGTANLKQLILENLKEPTSIVAKVERKERRKEAGKFDARVSDITVD